MLQRQSNAQDQINEPVRYTTSKAQKSPSINTFDTVAPITRQAPKCQPLIVSLSVAIFLIYFTMIRDENDIDELLSTSLYERIDGLEEADLNRAIESERELGRSTVELEKRLAKLEEAVSR